MHLVLTGATGLVGSAVLHHVLSLSSTSAASQRLNRLSIIVRRPDVPLLTHPDRPRENTFTKIEVIQHTDFKSYPEELLVKLKPDTEDGKLGVVWALGISQTEVKTDAEYVEITKEYAVEAAKAFSRSIQPSQSSADDDTATVAKKQLNFVYVSGEGANHNPGMLTPLFGRVKGDTEKDLFALMQSASENLKVYNVRPAAVDPVHQKAVADLMKPKDAKRGLGYRALKATLIPAMRAGLMHDTWSPTEELGKVFVDLAAGDGNALSGSGTEGFEGRILRNSGIRRLYQESK